MNDSIIPKTTLGSPQPSVIPTAAKESGITVIRNADVSSAPQAITPPADGKTITLRARVVDDKSLPPDQIRLRTDKGDVVIRSDTKLPADTEVMVDLQRQKTTLIANIRVAQRSADMQPPVPQEPAPVQTPPPQQAPQQPPQSVQPGDKLIALILSGSVPQPAPTPATPPLTSDQAIAIKQAALQLLASGGAAKAALPLSVLTGLTASADPAAYIKSLTPPQQDALRLLLPASAFETPDVPQPAGGTPPLPGQSPAIPAPETDHGENNLLALLKAMTSARLTTQALDQTPTAPQGNSLANNLIKSILPLIEGLQSQGMTQSLGTPPAPLSSAGSLFATQPSGAELKIITVTLPQGTPPQPAAGQIQGAIIGQTRDGMAVIKTPQADFVLSTRIDLPLGTTLTLEATPLSFSDLTSRMTATAGGMQMLLAAFDPLGDNSWPALDEAMAILARAQPDAAARLANTLPSPGPKMVPTTLFFLAALRLGIAENWLGAATLQGLRDNGGRSTAEKLTSDFGRIARQSGEPLPGEWRGISMPLIYDSQLSQLQMFVRKQKDDDSDNSSGGKTTRFIVNLNLSRLGGMQLDGLMHEANTAKGLDKRLDMVIRTDQRLSPGIMKDLQSAYAAGLKESQMMGALEFQAHKKGWVDIDHRTADSRSV